MIGVVFGGAGGGGVGVGWTGGGLSIGSWGGVLTVIVNLALIKTGVVRSSSVVTVSEVRMSTNSFVEIGRRGHP